MSILDLDKVSYQYATRHVTVEAVRGISYSFSPGVLYALRGPSGCGKTTLLSLMAGLDYPSAGDVKIGGTSTKKLDMGKYRREYVATIYQSLNLMPQLTASENISYPMELVGIKPKAARARAVELAGQVGLTGEELGRFPSMLSGGQQQRVAIARALGTSAKLILADEPTGSLDTTNSQNVIGLLLELAHTAGYCVVVVTHDPEVAAMADRVLVMQDGQIIHEETPRQ